DQVEDEDHLGLLPGLELCREHGGLNGDGRQQQEVVTAERRPFRVEEVRGDQKGQQQRAEQRGPALLDAEAHEFIKAEGYTPALGPGAEARLLRDKARERGPVARPALPPDPPEGITARAPGSLLIGLGGAGPGRGERDRRGLARRGAAGGLGRGRGEERIPPPRGFELGHLRPCPPAILPAFDLSLARWQRGGGARLSRNRPLVLPSQ